MRHAPNGDAEVFRDSGPAAEGVNDWVQIVLTAHAERLITNRNNVNTTISTRNDPGRRASFLHMLKSKPDQVACRIRAIRDDADITQAAMAERVGVSTGLVGQWEIGRNQPRYYALERLCNEFRVTADFVCFGDMSGLKVQRAAELRRFLDDSDVT